MARYDYRIPSDLIPNGDKCVPVLIPDNPEYVRIFTSHLRKLTLDMLYQRDDDKSALVVREQFLTRTYVPFLDALTSGDGCGDGGVSGGFDCLRLTTTENVIEFQYNDPFLPNNMDGDSTFLGEWNRWQDLRDLLPQQVENFIDAFENSTSLDADMGYFPNDCMIFPKIPDNPIDSAFGGIADLAQFKFPYITVNLRGSGEFEIELLNTPLGGTAMITWDFNPNVGAIVQDLIDGNPINLNNIIFTELSRDMTQIPPSTLERNSVEIQLEDDIEHVVRVYFLPTIDYTNLQFAGFGGGIRSVTACGNLDFIGIDGSTINQSNVGLRSARDGVLKGIVLSDVRSGVRDGILDVFRLAVAGAGNGSQGNITSSVSVDVDENGNIKFDTINITTPKAGAVINADKYELVYGGAVGVGEGFQEIVGQIVLNAQNNLALESIVNRARNLFDLVAPTDLADALFDSLGNTLANATDTVTPAVNPLSIAELIFCNVIAGRGVSKNALYQYSYDLEDSAGQDATHIALFYRSVIDSITDEQLNDWYATGTTTPNTGFLQSECYRYPTQVVDIPASELQVTKDFYFDEIWTFLASGRDVQVRFEGEIQLSNGDNYDGAFVNSGFQRFDLIKRGSDDNIVYERFEANMVNVVSGTVIAEQALSIGPGVKLIGMRLLTVFDNTLADSGNLTMTVIDLG